MRFIDLFAGIGGFSLGLERAGMTCVAQAEIDPFCQAVLAKHWPHVERFLDVKEVGKHNLPATDLICGGPPCQPHSVAGKRRGAADDRDLWPEYRRIIGECQPRWVLAENVVGIKTTILDQVLSDLESLDYATRTLIIPACAFDAPHKRERVFVIAHANGNTKSGLSLDEQWKISRAMVCNPASEGLQERNGNGAQSREAQPAVILSDWWAVESPVDRVAHGIPFELDIIGGLVNGKSDYQKTKSEINKLVWAILRKMWEYRELAKTSPRLYIGEIYNCVPEMPHRDSSGGWLLGKRIEADKELCDLWKAFYSAPYKESQDMQSDMLERIGKKKRPEEMGSRVNRLRALGNAVVPQVVEFIGRYIMEVERNLYGQDNSNCVPGKPD